MKYIAYRLAYLVILCGFAAAYWIRNQGFSVDDSFITYRYAYHLSTGSGLVFNVGQQYYGTTAAGYAVALAFAGRIGSSVSALLHFLPGQRPDIQAISITFSTFALLAVAVSLPIISRANNFISTWLLCLLSGMALFCLSPFNEVAGHETYAYLSAAFIGTVLMGYGRHYGLSALFFALATSFRPDAALFFFIAIFVDWTHSGSSIVKYSKRREFVIFTAISLVSVGAWLIYLQLIFGSPIPGTMEAKKVQVSLGHWPTYSPKVLWDYLSNSVGSLPIVFAAIGLLGLLQSRLPGRSKRVETSDSAGAFLAKCWLLFGTLSACAYFSFRVTFWSWYGVPIVFSVFVASFLGWCNILRAVAPTHRPHPERVDFKGMGALAAPSIAIPLIAIAGLAPGFANWATTKNLNPHTSAYSEIVDYIKHESPKGAAILMPEPGSFGYSLGPSYFVIDELGLISPGVANSLLRKDYSWALRTGSPKYVVCGWRGRYSACSNNLLGVDFELVGEFNEVFWKPKLGRGAELYRRKAPAPELDISPQSR